MGLRPWPARETRGGWLLAGGSSWDFPLCRRQKTCRLVQLFQSEVEHGRCEMDALQAKHSGERSQLLALLRSRQTEAHSCQEDDDLDEVAVRELRERLKTTSARLAEMEVVAGNLQQSCERSQMLEQQALNRVRELQTALALLREFGHEDFMQTKVAVKTDAEPSLALEERHSLAATEPAISNELHSEAGQSPLNGMDRLAETRLDVLISLELDLGLATETLIIAPWQTPADFETVVKEFLESRRVRPVFAEALVQYLTDVETKATAFPVMSKASLADIYSGYG